MVEYLTLVAQAADVVDFLRRDGQPVPLEMRRLAREGFCLLAFPDEYTEEQCLAYLDALCRGDDPRLGFPLSIACRGLPRHTVTNVQELKEFRDAWGGRAALRLVKPQ